MKKLLSILLIFTMLFPAAVTAESKEVKVYLNGERIEFDVQPIIENERTLVPMRAVFEAMNKKVTWFEDTKSAWAEDEKTLIYFWADGERKYISKRDIVGTDEERHLENERDIEIDVPARLVDGRTLVPLRAVSEAFDCDVQWDDETRTVSIASKKPDTLEPSYNYADKLMSNLPMNENYVISPFSLKMAMMMAANGSEGETQKEILDAFGVKDMEEFNSSAKAIIEELNADERAEINIANSIWFNKDIGGKNGDFADSFKEVIKNSFSGTAESVTNKNSIEMVNEWTEKQTKGKIKNLLSEDNRDYLAAIVNAVYMKAKWSSTFKKDDTYKETFTDTDGRKSETEFMHQTAHFNYYEDGDTKIVKMLYTNGMSMYISLGDTKNFSGNIKNMERKKVRLSLPKFKTEYNTVFNGILNNMGINKAFLNNNHDFDLMVKNVSEPLKIDTVLQKAMIDVDEEGTEAAAATAVMMELTSAITEPEEIVEFKADKPFTYYIIDDKSEEVLFAGRYVKSE